VQTLCAAAIAGDARDAARQQLQLFALHQALFVEPSPGPTKWALAQLGRCGATVRLPITPLSAAGQPVVACRDARSRDRVSRPLPG
jgi:4-hydroxy-tetrahydrodipicolinate synthase